MVALKGRALADLRLNLPAADLCARIILLGNVIGVLIASFRMLVTPVEVQADEGDPCLRSQRNLVFASTTLEANVPETNARTSMRSHLLQPSPLRPCRRKALPAPRPNSCGFLEGAGRYPEAASTSYRKSPLTDCDYGSGFACPAPSVARSVHFGPVEVRCFPSCVQNPRPVTRTRDPSYSWPPEIRCLKSIREHRRAHMKAVMWHKQVKLDDTDRNVLNDGPCVVQLTVDKRSASEMKAAAAKGMSRKRRLMLDSGWGIDLIGYSDFSSEERNMISDVAKLTLRTANGKTSTRGVAHMIVDGVEELIEAHVLESTPSLLSLGKRCLEHGYRFVWQPFAEPKFYDPHGTPVRIEVINNIPYLFPSETTVVSNKYRQQHLYSALPAAVMLHDQVVAPGESSGSGGSGAASSSSSGDAPPDPPIDEEVPPPPEAEHREDRVKRDLKMEAKSLSHLMTHLPKNPRCEICQRAKMENAKSYRGEGLDGHTFEKFGDRITLDTMVLHGLKNRGIRGETDAVVFFDFATDWLDAIPIKNRTNAETLNAFCQVIGEMSPLNTFSLDLDREYVPPNVQEVYCDKAEILVSRLSARPQVSQE